MRFKSYEPAEMMLSKPISIKKGCYTCQWLHNLDMHLYAKCDRNIPCTRVMSTDGQTMRLYSHNDYNADPRVMQDYNADPRVVHEPHIDHSADRRVV